MSLPDPSRPMPDEWYVKMMIKRLVWPKCEDRETVLALFRGYWPDPRISSRAEEFYDRAEAIIAERGR